MVKKATQTEYVHTSVRIPKEVHERLESDAERYARSLNAEIVMRVMAYDDIVPQLADLNRQMNELRKLVRKALEGQQ